MASTRLFMNLFMIFLILQLPESLSQQGLPTSTISAAPSMLPFLPLSSSPPTSSPDISPLFPSIAPTESSSQPTIPSSPSPPLADDDAAAGPVPLPMALSPDPAVSSSLALHAPVIVLCVTLYWIFHNSVWSGVYIYRSSNIM
ncbi:unnamed protein product [Cuscuta europaea]|uniref:Classical arabinogalactan protein 26-like n=1 Tax=Cuscuta europaea TaxID=41803 RepID=A0A9P0YZK7_CUSEU|nr:unnamed protein product [Cuscuta europaea]